MDPFYLITLALFGILVIILVLKLRNFMKLYAHFPSYPILYNMATDSSLRNSELRLPFRDVFFQTAIKASERFQKEGMFLAWLPQPHLFIFSEEAVKVFSNSLEKSYKYELLKDGVGSGLLISDSKVWRKQHKMLTPALHIGMLKQKLHIFNENAEILIKSLEESANRPCIDIVKYIQLCTLSIICDYTLGLKVNHPRKKVLLENGTRLISDLTQLLADAIVNPFYQYKFIMHLTPSGLKERKIINDINDITKKFIEDMKRNINQEPKIFDDDNSDDAEETKKFFANILLDQLQKDPSFTMEDILAHVKTFLVGGYHTIYTTIVWCLFMLALHPEVQDQVYNEIELLPEGHIKFDDLLHLKYLECVIKETLRFLPPGPIYCRRVTEDIEFMKYAVPKETTIVFFSYALHRNPNIFPEPEKFNPDRFMDEEREKLLWNFIPFAVGPRQCPGKRFAMLEVKVILAHILRQFQIKTLDSLEEIGVTWEIFMVPAKSPRFVLKSRNGHHI